MATKHAIYDSLSKFDNLKDPAYHCPKDCKFRDKLGNGGFYCNFIGKTNIPRREFNDGGRGCDLYTSGKTEKVRIRYGKNCRPKRELSESEMLIMQLYIDGKISQKKAFSTIGIHRKTFVRIYNELTGKE